MRVHVPTDERIATALERIATVLEDQAEMAKVPMLDAAAVLKAAAKEVTPDAPR